MLVKDGSPATNTNYTTEILHQKIDTGSDVAINSLSHKNLVVGRPIRFDGKTVVVHSEGRDIAVKILDILDIN